MGFSSFDRGTSEFFEGKTIFFNELKACAKRNEIRIFLPFKSYKLDSLTDAPWSGLIEYHRILLLSF